MSFLTNHKMIFLISQIGQKNLSSHKTKLRKTQYLKMIY